MSEMLYTNDEWGLVLLRVAQYIKFDEHFEY